VRPWRQILAWRSTTWIVTVEDQWQLDSDPRRYKIPANTPLQAAQKAAIKEGYSTRSVKVLNAEENAYEISGTLVIQVSSMEDIEELD